MSSSNPVTPFKAKKRKPDPVCFTRPEFEQILSLYGFFVAAGDWRDYAVDMLPERAVFSVFRRASEAPLYRIEKQPKLARKQGQFAVVHASGQTLKRGQDLTMVLNVFNRQKLKLT
ncbi:MAG: DUF2794 domain-containing protein [Parvularculaceae bacterium]